MNDQETKNHTKTRYQVEWCSEMKFDDIGDMRPDYAEYTVRNFPTLGLATAFAEKIIVIDYFGCPRIHHQIFGYECEWDNDKTWYTIKSDEVF